MNDLGFAIYNTKNCKISGIYMPLTKEVQDLNYE